MLKVSIVKRLPLVFCVSCLWIMGCAPPRSIAYTKQIDQLITKWHAAAAQADFDAYFRSLSNQAVFMGTQADEYWTKEQFMDYSKPHFDKGKAWTFHMVNRRIYEVNGVYYFDEVLKTQMGLCRGSGVVAKSGKQYKIQHYVLSIDIPNEAVNEVKQLKLPWDNQFIKQESNNN